jgi:superfamily I DNA/RNA helicase
VDIVHVAAGERFARAVAATTELADESFLTACIVAAEHVDATTRAFEVAGVAFGEPDRDGLGRPITVVPAPLAKGLEFDAVVVVEPAAIAASPFGHGAGDDPRGLRLLYVALTRPIQQLVVVHEAALPAALREPISS